MRLSKKGYFVVALAGVLIIGVVVLSVILTSVNKYQTQAKEMEFSDINIASIPDGVYTGECDLGLVYAKVEVVIRDGAIVGIKLLKHNNGRGASAEQIIDIMVDKQTTNVDVISGATNSSKVIRKAVENALSKNHPSPIGAVLITPYFRSILTMQRLS